MISIRPLTTIAVLAVTHAALAEPRVIKDITYAEPDGHRLQLDLYLPTTQQAAKPIPVVVFIHGGGWKNGSKAGAQKWASWLPEHGIAVAAIDYRLTDVAGWPAQIDDCYEAVRWLRQHGASHGIDPKRIGAWGTSAGGHLAILLGTRPYSGEETVSSRVQAVCDSFGPSDLLSMPPNNIGDGRTAEDVAKSNGAKLLRATVRDVPARARDASGLYHVTADDPSFLILHGDQDPGVPITQSIRLNQALIKAGVPVILKVVSGAAHGGKPFHTQEIRSQVKQFFHQTLTNTEK